MYAFIWVCLKMGYTPNYSHLVGIMISKTIGYNGVHYFQTNPYAFIMKCLLKAKKPLDCTDWVPPVRPWNDAPAIPSRHPNFERYFAPLEIQWMPYLWPPQLVDILGFLLDGFMMVLLYYVILRVVSNLQLDDLQFVYFSSLGPPLTLVISGHLWTFAELQQLQRHVQHRTSISRDQL